MLAPYRQVLAVPGALAFSAAGLLARFPIATLGLGTVLLVQADTGSYSVASAVAATLGITGAVAAPLLARLVDRHGQARVLRPALAVNALGLLALVLVSRLDAPAWALGVAAVLAGAATVSVGSLVRARWSRVLAGSTRLHTAYSLESALDEVVFIVGPVVVTWLATAVSPAAGVLVAVAAALVGGYALAAQRRTEPLPHPRTGDRGGPSLLRTPGMVVLAITFLFAGGVFGATEVTTVAFAHEQGAPAAAGVVLAVFAFGSMVAGLAYGAVHWRASATRRFSVAVVVLAVGVAPCLLVGSLASLGAVLLVAGLAISPMIVAGFGLVEVLVAPARLTEGITWVSTAISLGANAGVAAAGPTIDAYGAHRAWMLPVASALTAALTVAAGHRWLAPRRPSPSVT